MGRLLTRAIEAAGLSDISERTLAGDAIGAAELARLRSADILAVATLADQVRSKFHGDEVRVIAQRAASELRAEGSVTVTAQTSEAHGETGADFLREVALLRLATPGAHALAVSVESVGLELAQAALVFGASELLVDLGGKRTLPLLDGPEARREELRGLCERAGRNVRFVERVSGDDASAQPTTRAAAALEPRG